MLYENWLNRAPHFKKHRAEEERQQFGFRPKHVFFLAGPCDNQFLWDLEAWCRQHCTGRYYVSFGRNALFLEVDHDMLLAKLSFPEYHFNF